MKAEIRTEVKIVIAKEEKKKCEMRKKIKSNENIKLNR